MPGRLGQQAEVAEQAEPGHEPHEGGPQAQPGPRDQHNAAAHRVARVEGGDRVVGHIDAYRRANELREDRTTALSVGGAIAARAREDDRDRNRACERFRKRRADRPSRIGRREQIRAAARAAPDDTTFAIDRERARLRPAGVDPHDERSGHQGWWIAPPETARDAPVALGRMFGFPCMR